MNLHKHNHFTIRITNEFTKLLSDVGDNRNFGHGYVESTAVDIVQIINSSSAVVLTNWTSNLRG